MSSDEFTAQELRDLFRKCCGFVKRNGYPNMEKIEYLYRCKPQDYWDDIRYFNNNLMETYIKDDNGHSENLINGEIDGLFFSGRLCGSNLKLPNSSPFGNIRMDIKSYLILNPNKHNFYFADFYCNKKLHYVTIVVCVNNSDADDYCQDNLIKLNKFANPFIKAEQIDGRRHNFYINNDIWVEIFYTEDINLNGKEFTRIRATGKGSSNFDGVPNNKRCKICNL
ncbi:Phytanoyl-CoA hydroxylase-interacting protein-like C-terminal domain-containing protein [Caenorhabditis elegans]|uniref:Phytanoyl-CoA hydroxylase-interacting protein-like C-terminal domain-containing protein n=1 Tax=Caenorhabditis elegans TaxID=6239 RepID=G8JZJ6_CAEEL|nr:Phytanoyl-CoA hydroxylase-interacting protein-like C-terminal domain-containing protein [Caenorhabditis elegans]CCE71622.1 Phytanoyl-CoA hydroxylase-interacting protein-like C-terminal domain-containing protein [Caenorhabditis elegans]|eukprot:NP_001263898.1 Uncharacterized protein CELE_T10H4.13 [Caenorhabditis elegans]